MDKLIAVMPDIETLVNRFLAWKLPASVCADTIATEAGHKDRSGTNLLTAEEAKAMFEHVLRAPDQVAWLIECGERMTVYWAEDGDWCSNPNHAHRFGSASLAQQKASTMKTLAPTRVVEHMWTS